MGTTSIITDPTGAKIGANATLDIVQQFSLGHLASADYGGKFVYCKAGSALAAGDFVVIDKDYNASGLTTTNGLRGMRVGVARQVATTSNWLWIQIAGGVPGRTANAVAANAQINTTATAGAIDDDATVSTKRIDGIYIPTAAAGATTNTEFHLNYPVIGATL